MSAVGGDEAKETVEKELSFPRLHENKPTEQRFVLLLFPFHEQGLLQMTRATSRVPHKASISPRWVRRLLMPSNTLLPLGDVLHGVTSELTLGGIGWVGTGERESASLMCAAGPEIDPRSLHPHSVQGTPNVGARLVHRKQQWYSEIGGLAKWRHHSEYDTLSPAAGISICNVPSIPRTRWGD